MKNRPDALASELNRHSRRIAKREKSEPNWDKFLGLPMTVPTFCYDGDQGIVGPLRGSVEASEL
jgi:hypothetical protein